MERRDHVTHVTHVTHVATSVTCAATQLRTRHRHTPSQTLSRKRARAVADMRARSCARPCRACRTASLSTWRQALGRSRAGATGACRATTHVWVWWVRVNGCIGLDWLSQNAQPCINVA
eukprot:365698-Chlamydomonas_euryale.AAC.1